MVKKKTEGGSTGRITSGISRDTLRLETIDYIYHQLPAWRSDPDRRYEKSESKLNPQLCKFLKLRANREFPMITFNHEEPQSPNRNVDLSVTPTENISIYGCLYTIYDPFLVVECKRLPAPVRKREKEYVSGTEPNHITGGIQRFKLGLHSGNLSPAVMIGYIQSNTADHWCNQINKWISELTLNPIGDGCVWSKQEILSLLEKKVDTGLAKYTSNHMRTNQDSIEIYHLWIKMS